MRCEEFNQWLDLLMDDALDAAQRQQMNEHARTCPDCAEQLKATLRLKDMLDDLPEEVDVPLAAQAGWRNAVRAEARRAGKRRFTRLVSMAAAAALVVVGVSLALPNRRMADTVSMKAANSGIVAESAVMEDAEESVMEETAGFDGISEAVETGGVMLAADSASDSAMEEDAGETLVSLSITVSDLQSAGEGILDTAREYDAGATLREIDGGAQLEARLSCGDAAELLEAVRQWDVNPDGVSLPELSDDGSTALLINIWSE